MYEATDLATIRSALDRKEACAAVGSPFGGNDEAPTGANVGIANEAKPPRKYHSLADKIHSTWSPAQLKMRSISSQRSCSSLSESVSGLLAAISGERLRSVSVHASPAGCLNISRECVPLAAMSGIVPPDEYHVLRWAFDRPLEVVAQWEDLFESSAETILSMHDAARRLMS